MGSELRVGGFARMAAKAVMLIVFSQNGQQDSDQVVTRFLKNRHGDASGVREPPSCGNYALPTFASSWSSCFARISAGVEPSCLLLPPMPVETVRIFPAIQ